MTYWLHPGAEQDIANALDFYVEHAGPAVAGSFLDAFERVAKLLLQFRGMGIPAANGRRIFPLNLFPHSVVYRPLDTGIRILVVRHQLRKPSHAEHRQ